MDHRAARLTLLLSSCVCVAACTAGAQSEGPASSGKADDLGAGGDIVCAATPTSLRIPLLEDRGALISSFNDEIRAAGFTELADTMLVSGDEEGRRAFSQWRDHVELLADAAGMDMLALGFAGDPSDYRATRDDGSTAEVCFEGNVFEVADTVAALGDNVFSDQTFVAAWRTGDTEFVDDDLIFDDSILGELPAEWESFIGDADSVLVITVSNDSGDDYTASVISRCGGAQR